MEYSNTQARNQEPARQGVRLPKCPHCGKRVNPFLAWSVKSQGEYVCGSCGSFSNIRLAKPLYVMGLIAVLLAAILLLIFFLTGSMNLYLLLLMLVPFLAFTVISPFFVRLEKIAPPSARRKQPAAQQKKKEQPKTQKAQKVQKDQKKKA